MGMAEPLIQTALLGEAVDGGPLPVFVADETMKYIAVNRTACDWLGYTREELLGRRVDEVADYEEAPEEFSEMMSEGVRGGTSILRRKDGSTVRFRYRAGTTTVAGMTVYVAVGVPA